MMRRLPLLVAAAGAALLAGPASNGSLSSATAAVEPPSQGMATTVEMSSNVYVPREVRVDVGGTVTWEAVGSGHDVRADDGSFWLWRGETDDNDGQTRAHTFDEPGVYPYYCTLHGGPGGNGMAGVVFVGDAQLEAPPELDVPSATHPTLRSALRDARRGSTINLAPGVHRAGQRIIQDGVTIRGTGDRPSDVRLRAATAVGLRIEADDVTLADLRVDAGSRSGIEAVDVDRLRLEDVVVTTDHAGVRFEGGRGLTVRGGRIAHHDRAGILISGCDPCDARIEQVHVAANALGVDVVDAAGVLLRDSTIRDNGAGVRAASTPAGPTDRARTVTVRDNRIIDNHAAIGGGLPDAELSNPTGAGIWLAGAQQTEVLGNRVSGPHRYGVAVSALAAASRDVTVRGNRTAGATDAELAWDGLGTQVCFADNVGVDGDDPTTQPPGLQTTASCDLPVQLGVPDPRPLLGQLGGALTGPEDASDDADADG